MAKINFTKEHLEKMKELAIDMLLNNMSITTTMGTVLNISELMHTTTIGTLNKIRLVLTKKIRDAEDKDEWADFSDSKYLDTIRKQKDLVNLIIGWKRYNMEKEANEARRKELEKKLDELKESQKTPEDKIKELEAQIKGLSDEEVF